MVTGSYIVNGKEEQFGADGVWVDTSKAQEASNADNSLMNYGPGISRWGRDDRGWYYQNFDGRDVYKRQVMGFSHSIKRKLIFLTAVLFQFPANFIC